ncbi:MAG: hypothetical protein FJZ01_26340 [Candidatus Sericytochromatia bacterium]|nr:hypothetical protein [Candidatus Tanganyikabacteria bacterium]
MRRIGLVIALAGGLTPLAVASCNGSNSRLLALPSGSPVASGSLAGAGSLLPGGATGSAVATGDATASGDASGSATASASATPAPTATPGGQTSYPVWTPAPTPTPFRPTHEMVVRSIDVRQGAAIALPEPKFAIDLVYTGTGSCLPFSGTAFYEAGTGSVSFTSGNTSLVEINSQGLACVTESPSGSLRAFVPVQASAVGTGDFTVLTFYLRVLATGSLDVGLY